MTQTTLSPEERAKSLGEKLSDAFDQTRGTAPGWTTLRPEDRRDFEVMALLFAGSLTHDETASAVIAALTARAEKAEQQAAAFRDAVVMTPGPEGRRSWGVNAAKLAAAWDLTPSNSEADNG